MSDEQTKIRERLETSKQEGNVVRGWAWTVVALSIAVLCLTLVVTTIFWGIPTLIAAKGYWTNESKVLKEKLEPAIDDLAAAVKDAKEGVGQIGPTLKGLQDTETQATGYLSDLRGETRQVVGAAVSVVNQSKENLSSVKGATDEVTRQIKQNGDAAAATLASANRFINETDTRVSKLLDDGSVMLETANPKLQALLTHADAVVVTADGTIKAYEPVGVKLASTLGHLDNMAADSEARWHGLLFPPKTVGFWAHVKTYAAFALHSAFDGLNLYYKITALPVKITQPIPVLK